MRESVRQGVDFKAREAQMAADNAAHADRMSAIIQDTNRHTTDVMRDMIASNAASHERVANLHSEMIGGYDVYRTADGGTLRADTTFDHVYQGTVDGQEWFVGVEGDWLEPGVDFVPLGRVRGGNY